MTLAKLLLVASIWSLVGANSLAETKSDDEQVVFNFYFYLQQLGEPDLRESCSDEAQTIRLVANAMSQGAWSVRVERTESMASVHFSQGEALGTPTIASRTLDDSTWIDLQRIVDTENIRDMPLNNDTWIPDGTIASIETCIDGRYAVIQRQFWHPETKELVSVLKSLRPGDQESPNNALHL